MKPLTLPEGTRGFHLTKEDLRTWSQDDPAFQDAALRTLCARNILFVAPDQAGQYITVQEDGTWKIAGTLEVTFQSA